MKPSAEFTAKVRARIKEITGEDYGPFIFGDIWPGPNFNEDSAASVNAIAESMVRSKDALPVDIDDEEIDTSEPYYKPGS